MKRLPERVSPAHQHIIKRRSRHIHRPGAEPGMFNPCSKHHVTTDDLRCIPKDIAGQKMPPRPFWDVVAVMAQLSQDGRPCYAGLKDLCRATLHSRATVVKYRKLAQALGMFEVMPRGGKGKGRLTTLCRPKESPYWGCFRPKAEFNSYPKHLTFLEVKYVNSTPDAPSEAVIDQAEPIPPNPANSIDSEHAVQDNQAEKPAAAVWSVAIFIALIARIVGWSIEKREAQSILKTIHNKGLSIHSPERVVYAIREDLTHYGGFNRFRPERIHSPGAAINGATKRLDPNEVAEVKVPEVASSNSGESTAELGMAYQPWRPPKKPYQCEVCQDSGWKEVEINGLPAAVKCDHPARPEPSPPDSSPPIEFKLPDIVLPRRETPRPSPEPQQLKLKLSPVSAWINRFKTKLQRCRRCQGAGYLPDRVSFCSCPMGVDLARDHARQAKKKQHENPTKQ